MATCTGLTEVKSYPPNTSAVIHSNYTDYPENILGPVSSPSDHAEEIYSFTDQQQHSNSTDGKVDSFLSSYDFGITDPELERLVKEYTCINEEGVAPLNKLSVEEMSPKTAESIRAVGDCSSVEEDSIQADPEGSQLALPDAPGQTRPRQRRSKFVGRTPNSETRSKRAGSKRKAETSTTLSNKKRAIEGGETVANLTQPSPEPVQPLSPSTASHPDDGRLSVPQDATQHDVDDDILDGVDAEGSLGDKVINHSLKKLADMFPCTVRVLDSLEENKSDSDYTWHQCTSSKRATTPFTLIPIHIRPPNAVVDHWVLAVLDSSGVRLLDSKTSAQHKTAATERIKTLFRRRSIVVETIQEVRLPRATHVSEDISVFWGAIYVIGLSYGAEIPLPETFDSETWRTAMLSFLRLAAGKSHDFLKNNDTESPALTLYDGQIVERLRLSFSTGTELLTVNPCTFLKDLRQQIALTEKAKKDVDMEKAGELRSIRTFLGGLMEATAKERAILERKEKDCQTCVDKIDEFRNSWGEYEMGNLAREKLRYFQEQERLREDMAGVTRKLVEELDHAIEELETT